MQNKSDVFKKVFVGQALPDNAPAKGHLPGFGISYSMGKSTYQQPPTTGCSYRNIVRQCLTYNGKQQVVRMAHGFTLIELLVVVLIIGILAAVAVPQYEAAVWKARFSEVLINISTLQRAVALYRLQHGVESSNLTDEDLDISVFEGLTLEETGHCSQYVCYQAASLYAVASVYKDKVHTDRFVQAGATFDTGTNSWVRYCYYEGDLGKKLCAQAEALGWEDVAEGF